MPTTAHTHCAPYWEQEVSLSLKLLYHFHKIVMFQTALIACTCFQPHCGPPRQARGCKRLFNAAYSFNFVLHFPATVVFRRTAINAGFTPRNASTVSLGHIWIIFWIAVSIVSFILHSLLVLAHSEGGGDLPLSVINYGRYSHVCCIVSVVEVLDRLENLMLCLVNKTIWCSVKLCCTALCIKMHSCQLQLVGSGDSHCVS